MQDYDTMHFWAYLAMLLGGIFVLLCLHLLVEDHDLRPFAIPLLTICVLQLCAIVFRYVFDKNPNGLYLFGDFTIFIVMISISVLMLVHIGILSPIRDQISALFNQNSNHNGNGGE
jgi:glucan phosphoethanolaminetransferase (alkaline phosphatase superfamily)